MGKVDCAFDHIKDNHIINELSVVLYTDSFFYGLWDGEATLVKTGYHPLVSLSALVQLWQYHYKFNFIKVISTIKPFVHLADQDFEEEHFDVYFTGLYNLERVDHNVRTVDRIKNFPIATLHFVEEQAMSQLAELGTLPKLVHLSTAMVNYCSAQDEKLLCFIANNTMHVSYLSKKGFRIYNQYDCFYEQDYLYFLLAIFKSFKLDPSQDAILMAGSLDKENELYGMLSSYFTKLRFLSKAIKVPSRLKLRKNYFSDLHLCKTCV